MYLALKLLLVELPPDRIELLHGDGFPRLPLENEKAQRTNLEFLRRRIGSLRRGSQLPAQSMLHNGFESGAPSVCQSLGLLEQGVVKFQSGLHIWVTTWAYGQTAIIPGIQSPLCKKTSVKP